MIANHLQNYKNDSTKRNSDGINGYILAKINRESLKLMSEIGLDIGDWRYVPMIEQYVNMASMSISRKNIYAILSKEYNISESSVKRVIRRMLKRVRM